MSEYRETASNLKKKNTYHQPPFIGLMKIDFKKQQKTNKHNAELQRADPGTKVTG